MTLLRLRTYHPSFKKKFSKLSLCLPFFIFTYNSNLKGSKDRGSILVAYYTYQNTMGHVLSEVMNTLEPLGRVRFYSVTTFGVYSILYSYTSLAVRCSL